MMPSEFLDFAVSLCVGTKPRPECAASRSITSRAYYATFHATREFLIETDDMHSRKKKSKHEWNIKSIRCSQNKIMQIITEQLKDLRARREAADYELGDSESDDPSWAKDAVEIAKSMIGDLEKIRRDPAWLASVGQEIKSGLQKTGQYREIGT